MPYRSFCFVLLGRSRRDLYGLKTHCLDDSLGDDEDERTLMRALDPHAQAAFMPSKQPAPSVRKQQHRARIAHTHDCPVHLMEKVLRH